MNIGPEVLDYCLKDYQSLKRELIKQEQLSDFDIDYELRFVLFLSAQIDGVQKIEEQNFILSVGRFLEWSSVYDSLLLGKIEKQPSYQLIDIALGKRFTKIGEVFYKLAYCMVLIDREFNTDEKCFIRNLKDHLFGLTQTEQADRIEVGIVGLDQGETIGLDREAIQAKANRHSQETPKEEPLSLQECLDQLNQLVGLQRMKEEVKKLVNFLEIQTKRKEHQLSLSQPTLHMIFTGPPGTGKTTVARLMAKIYYNLGFLVEGHLVETDRSGLVGQYMGHTDAKTTEVIDRALNGVLFIDEAYSLNKSSENDFGQEAIDTLVKRMEDDRDRLVVIVAGYSEEMGKFIASNPGLRSRFNNTIHFENFKPKELLEIFKGLCKKNDYTLDSSTDQKLIQLFMHETKKNRTDFGNGRFVRNLFENVLRNQAMRLNTAKQTLSREDLMLLLPADVIQPEHAESTSIERLP